MGSTCPLSDPFGPWDNSFFLIDKIKVNAICHRNLLLCIYVFSLPTNKIFQNQIKIKLKYFLGLCRTHLSCHAPHSASPRSPTPSWCQCCRTSLCALPPRTSAQPSPSLSNTLDIGGSTRYTLRDTEKSDMSAFENFPIWYSTPCLWWTNCPKVPRATMLTEECLRLWNGVRPSNHQTFSFGI